MLEMSYLLNDFATSIEVCRQIKKSSQSAITRRYLRRERLTSGDPRLTPGLKLDFFLSYLDSRK